MSTPSGDRPLPHLALGRASQDGGSDQLRIDDVGLVTHEVLELLDEHLPAFGGHRSARR
jgi:hypothetical protein